MRRGQHDALELEADVEIAREKLVKARELLDKVYQQAGNEAPGNRRHALSPALRDEIWDWLHKGKT